MKYKIILVMLLILLPITMAYTEVEYSLDNLTFKHLINTENNSLIIEGIEDGINEDTTYYFRLRNVYDTGTSTWVYREQKTDDVTQEADMSSIAITLFILTIAIALFILPFKVKFHKHQVVNNILRRSMWVIMIFLMMMNSSIMATFAKDAGLDLQQEMFRYMWIFGWAGYLLMTYMVLVSIFDFLKMWKVNKEKKRFGEEEGDDGF